MARYGAGPYGGSSSTNSGGTVYGRGAGNFIIRRHSVQINLDIPALKAMILPILAYQKTEPASGVINDYGGIAQKYYPTTAVQEGSRVNAIKFDILITPTTESDSAVIDFYTGRIQTSFHDIKSGEIRGLRLDADQQPVYEQDDKTIPTGGNAAITAAGHGPELDFNKQRYDYSVTIKHWWRGVTKQILASGVPVMYNRMERTPPKVKRSNRGMFYGMVLMNDSSASLHIDYKLKFTEIPLVQ